MITGTKIQKNSLSEVSPRRKQEITALFQASRARIGGPYSIGEIISKLIAPGKPGSRKGNLAPGKKGAFFYKAG